jgi:hypothetical protein
MPQDINKPQDCRGFRRWVETAARKESGCVHPYTMIGARRACPLIDVYIAGKATVAVE